MTEKSLFLKRLEKLSKQWFFEAPFFNEFLLRFSCEESLQIPTIAVGLSKDKRSIAIYYNKDFVNQLSDSDFEGVIVHEIMHVIALSYERKNSRNNKLWNIATDIANNYEILKSTISGRTLTLPQNGYFLSFLDSLTDQKYNGKIIAEDIYDFIAQSVGEDDNIINGKFNGLNGENFDDHSLLDESQLSLAESEIFRQLAGEMVNSAKTRKFGNISGSLKDKIIDILNPKINFLNELAYHLNAAKFCGSSTKRSSYVKLNRRGYNELPGKIKEKVLVNIGVDVSGSISDEDLKKFFGGIDWFSKQYEINLILFDCEVKSNQKYQIGAWKNITIEGRGGTDISAFYDFVDKQKTNEALNIIFTDGQFNWNIDWKGRKDKSLFILLNNYKPSDKSIRSINL